MTNPESNGQPIPETPLEAAQRRQRENKSPLTFPVSDTRHRLISPWRPADEQPVVRQPRPEAASELGSRIIEVTIDVPVNEHPGVPYAGTDHPVPDHRIFGGM